jgi:hypothetical protein
VERKAPTGKEWKIETSKGWVECHDFKQCCHIQEALELEYVLQPKTYQTLHFPAFVLPISNFSTTYFANPIFAYLTDRFSRKKLTPLTYLTF